MRSSNEQCPWTFFRFGTGKHVMRVRFVILQCHLIQLAYTSDAAAHLKEFVDS